jgi:TonB family protein
MKTRSALLYCAVMRRDVWLPALLLSSLALAVPSIESFSSSPPTLSSRDPLARRAPQSENAPHTNPTSGSPQSPTGAKAATGSETTGSATAEPQTDTCGAPVEGQPKVVRVTEGVTQGQLVHKVNPKYPKAARKARIQGTVLLCAAISKEGRIANLRAASGPEVLIPSALKAVQQWRYKPYLLQGEAVEVQTEIRVNFQLQ